MTFMMISLEWNRDAAVALPCAAAASAAKPLPAPFPAPERTGSSRDVVLELLDHELLLRNG
ncbi:MAG TPA: hypothetical protein PK375_11940, partial [Rhodocyclaceae bacterium]|nr:hypothetical protein [Rhodocyclaceae bacterium]